MKKLALLVWISPSEALRHPSLHGERDQLLLRAVVKVPLETPTLLVLRGDQALAGGTEILDEPGVPKDEARLRGEIVEKLLLDRREALVRWLGQGERAEDLAVMPHGYGKGLVDERGKAVA
jgi:hypothetical protein